MIKFAFRWAFRFLVLAVVLAVGLILLKDNLVREATQRKLQRQTGWQVRIGAMQMGLLSPTVSIQNLVIYNPAEFGGGPFVDVPDLHIEYALGKMPWKGMHLKLLRLEVRELHIVENRQGETNLIQFLEKTVPNSGARSSRRGGSTNDFEIDMLNLSVGTVRYSHLGHPRRTQEVQAGMRHAIITDLRNKHDVAGVFLKVLVRAGITIYLDKPRARAETAAGAVEASFQPARR